jgi:hypothetical protein
MDTTFDIRRALIIASVCTAATSLAWSQKAGQSISIQYGTVSTVKEVDLKSAAVPAGALVGGGLGLISGSGKSSGKKARNGIVGAIAGGVIAGVAQGSQRGTVYDVSSGNGVIQIVSDQREIRAGDCVAVERAGDTANIRRVSSSYCEKGNEAAVKSVAPEASKDAEECVAAKQQLVDASTTQQADLAARKIALLCNN